MEYTRTPMTALQAIVEAGPNPEAIRRALVDYLAQRFGVAMLESPNPEVQAALRRLWVTIQTREIDMYNKAA